MAKDKPRRTPDGRLETRSLDDMLKQAVDNEDLTTLPGYGRPIDLKGYSTSDPETRVASKLLGDNQVLPQPLQDRIDAENLRRQADDYLTVEDEHLQEMRQRIQPLATAFTAPFPDQQTVLEVLQIESWPSCLPKPTDAELPRLKSFVKTGRMLVEHMSKYNRRVDIVVCQYLERLSGYNECVERVAGQIPLATGLPAAPTLRAADPAAEEQTARTRLGLPLAALPADIEQRLERYHRSVSPSIWQRMTSFLRSG
tara:strand:- start:216 stop:980 length:765 start_codon:yes stop_codon:yes gene_type:complete